MGRYLFGGGGSLLLWVANYLGASLFLGVANYWGASLLLGVATNFGGCLSTFGGSLQPRSQGLSSSRPLLAPGGGKKRDPEKRLAGLGVATFRGRYLFGRGGRYVWGGRYF